VVKVCAPSVRKNIYFEAWLQALIVRLIVFVLPLMFALKASATIYYVDSAGGGDTNSGTSTNAAWQTLAKVNGTTFLHGDSILFKAGGSWNGTTQLNPKGSGTSGSPIVIDMYGTGPKPIINAGSATGNGALYLSNQSYWEINNLEITSDATSDGDRRGVDFIGTSGNIIHLYLRNCYIHNIRGTLQLTDGGSTSAGKRTGGMVVENTGSASFSDIRIENNEIQTVRNIGLVACLNANSAQNVFIRGNVIHDVTKNAMIVRVCDNTCLIEHNLCYNTANATTGNTMFTAGANGPVFQYNEAYANMAGNHDGSMYDADLNSQNVVFQYSYSHDNSHGLFWQYSSGPDLGIICRYNISQNDQGNIFSINGGTSSAYFYNNTIYMNAAVANPSYNYVLDERSSSGHSTYFYNNIFYNLQGKAYNLSSGNTHVFDYNVFYGQHPASEPADAHKLTSDPLLIAPGTGSTSATNSVTLINDMNSLGGYKLQAGSPCIDSGTNITSNGGFDFFGNSVPFNGVPDRGANEWYPASSSQPPILNLQSPSVSPNSATLDALVNPGNAPTSCYFAYGTSTNYGGFTATNSLSAGTNSLTVSNQISGLLSGTLYHYRAFATNSAGGTNTSDATFNTSAVTPPFLNLTNSIAGGGKLKFSFASTPGVNFTVLGTTDIVSPLINWTVLGAATEYSVGQYTFTDLQATNNIQRFYRVHSP
jgi:hypothetical protein